MKKIALSLTVFLFLFNIIGVRMIEADNAGEKVETETKTEESKPIEKKEEEETLIPPELKELRETGKGKEEVVYNLDLFNGKDYTPGVFSPLKAETIYIIAGVNNVFSPEITKVYFWPVTGEYVADWFALDEYIGETLEILKGDKVIHSLKKEKYSLSYAEGEYTLLVGEEATQAYQNYKKAKEAYSQYWKDYIDYQQKLAEYQRKKSEGKENLKEPEPPKEPERPKAEIPEPRDAFIVNLEEGKYKIRVRDSEGKIIEGTEKSIIVFSGKQAVGYQIIRKDNWPARCDNPLETIYVAEKDILYFTPIREIGYDNFYYNKMLDPQTIKGVKGAWSWVYLEPTKNLTLNFSKGGKILEKVEVYKYYVDLIPGHALGFNIVKYDEENPPEGSPTQFMAYKVELKEKGGYTIELQDYTGEIIPGSKREIRMVREENTQVVYLPALISLPFGLFIYIMRRRK